MMNMSRKLTPTPDELEALRKTAPEGPVVIVNLLKFKSGPDAHEAYRQYVAAARKGTGPRPELLYQGTAAADLTDDGPWDYVIINRCRSFDDFATNLTSAAYQVAAAFRPAALERTVMLVTTPGGGLV